MAEVLQYQIPFAPFTLQQVLWAAIILAVGLVIVRILVGATRRGLERLGLSPLAAGVLSRLASAVYYTALALAVGSALGFATGSIVLGLSAVIGLILGFGLQDTVSNLAAGVWIAASRPFTRGDLVEMAGFKGVVSDVGILSTILDRPDGEVVFIPNKMVWGAPLVNYTRKPLRRISFTVGVAYGTDLDKAVRVALDAVSRVKDVLDSPPPQVVVTGLADSSINLSIRAWVKKEDYGAVRPELVKAVYNSYNEAGIEIPYPQLDVHIRDLPQQQ